MPGSHEQQDRVRERFTRTAEQFAKFSLSTRAEEAEKLVSLALPLLRDPAPAVALDVACGPGTFTRAFASRVKSIRGIDLTPALLDQARAAAEKAGLPNCVFECGNAETLPYPDKSFDLGICAYAVHHFANPKTVMGELARVMRPGGVVALVDVVVPQGALPDAANAIECARDASHEYTYSVVGLHEMLELFLLRVRRSEIGERTRSFNDWMQIAGWQPGDAAYVEARRLMEMHLERDTSGFAPRRIAGSDDLAFTQTSLFVVAEK